MESIPRVGKPQGKTCLARLVGTVRTSTPPNFCLRIFWGHRGVILIVGDVWGGHGPYGEGEGVAIWGVVGEWDPPTVSLARMGGGSGRVPAEAKALGGIAPPPGVA